MAYATPAQIAEYMGLTEAELPQDIDRMLARVDELIDSETFGRLKDTTDEDYLLAAQKAESAQIEYWLEAVGEETDIHGHVKNYSVGSFSMEMSGGIPNMAPRARRHLRDVGLLNQPIHRGARSVW